MKISSLQKGLVGHWTMSQDSLKGSLLADKTPYENDGTIYGATFTTDRKGKANSAMSFDGVGDYIDCGNDSSLNITDAITISAWVKFKDNSNDYRRIVTKNRVSSYCLRTAFAPDNKIEFCLHINGEIRSILSSPTITGQFNFITATYDGSVMQLWVNGILQSDTKYISGNIGTDNDNVLIGKRQGVNAYFQGSIDDVRIYNRALSQEEITLLYNSYNPKIIL
jgi:hypothetical protein